MLEFNHVSKIYDNNIVAVNDISFKVKDGEFVFLIGASGSGKTTAIKLLIRDENPTSGAVYFKDRDITKISRSRVYKVRREIGVIFQDYKLIQDKTAYENVAFAMEVAGKKNKEIRETVPYVLDIVGLNHRSSSFPRQLSGGEQQRVAIARAISNSPQVLIADEPTGNLDPSSAWDIVQILNKINNWGTTIIMSTHGTDIVNSLNKRVIQMENGKIIRDDNKGQYELAQKQQFEEQMSGNADEVVKKKEKLKIKIDFEESPEEPELEVEEGLEIEAAPKRGGIFSFFRRSKPVTTNYNALEQILGERPNPEHQEEVENEDQDSENVEIENIVEDQKPEKKSTPKKSVKKEVKPKKATTKKTRPLSMDGSNGEIHTELGDTSLDQLDLEPELIEVLKEAGYNNVEEIVNDGVEILSEKVDLSKRELLKIARSIKSSHTEE